MILGAYIQCIKAGIQLMAQISGLHCGIILVNTFFWRIILVWNGKGLGRNQLMSIPFHQDLYLTKNGWPLLNFMALPGKKEIPKTALMAALLITLTKT